jgi:hypothetical protein
VTKGSKQRARLPGPAVSPALAVVLLLDLLLFSFLFLLAANALCGLAGSSCGTASLRLLQQQQQRQQNRLRCACPFCNRKALRRDDLPREKRNYHLLLFIAVCLYNSSRSSFVLSSLSSLSLSSSSSSSSPAADAAALLPWCCANTKQVWPVVH